MAVGLRRLPNCTKLLTEQAWQLTATARFVDACSAAKRGLELSPEDPDVLLAYAYVQSHLGSISASEAVDVAGRLVASSPKAVWSWTAADLLRAGGASDQLKAYENALNAALKARIPELRGAAWCLFHLRRYDEAINHLDRCIAERPGSDDEKLDRAVIQFVGLECEEARASLQVMIPKAAVEGSRIESVCAIKYLVPQWKVHGLGRAPYLEELERMVDSALSAVRT